MNATVIVLAAALALTACAKQPPAAVPAAPLVNCPEPDPAQPNCKVVRP